MGMTRCTAQLAFSDSKPLLATGCLQVTSNCRQSWSAYRFSGMAVGQQAVKYSSQVSVGSLY